MPACSSCGEPLRDGVWFCGACGAPVSDASSGAGASDDPYAEASVSSLPPSPPAAESGGISNLVKLVVLGGLVAVLAIAGIWFFVLRSSGDSFFIGTWSSSAGGQFRIEKAGSDLHLFIIDAHGKSLGPLKTSMNGDALETTLEPAGGSDQDKAEATLVRTMLTAMFKTNGFKLRFSRGEDTNHVNVTVPGVAGGSAADQYSSLTREQ